MSTAFLGVVSCCGLTFHLIKNRLAKLFAAGSSQGLQLKQKRSDELLLASSQRVFVALSPTAQDIKSCLESSADQQLLMFTNSDAVGPETHCLFF